MTPDQDQINDWLKIISFVFEGTNSLITLDDCAASRDVKQRSDELVELAFSTRHKRINIWVLIQQMTSIAKPYRENIAALALFYTPWQKDMKIIFKSYAGGLSNDEKNKLINKLKRVEYSHLVFSLCHPYSINRVLKWK